MFYNLKPVYLHVACIPEQNVTQDRALDKRSKDKFNNKLRYLAQIRKTEKTSEVLQIPSCVGSHVALRDNFVATFRDNLPVPSPPLGPDSSAWNYDSALTPIMDPIGWSETSIWDYHSTLSKTPDDRRSHVHCSGSLKSHSGKYLNALPTYIWLNISGLLGW